ncbi:ornithine carbamoyltransferase 1 [Escherichia coli]|uniref:Ornithine carbamoyltransferase 1 n=1 Tax=Escherichia coli TaxID=562 RepID=A0A377AQT4_ECOLX|nr:ornithine carbamoyltransferase 1 [Escherichia coli]
MTRVLALLISAQAAARLVIKSRFKDTARVLGRMYDGIQYRGYGQEIVETLAEYAGVPVWNGLTNEFHPTQLLADLLTMQEHLPGKTFNEMTLVYAGDARNNMGNSMLEAAALTGLDLRLVAPKACWPEAALVTECRAPGTAKWRGYYADGRCSQRS